VWSLLLLRQENIRTDDHDHLSFLSGGLSDLQARAFAMAAEKYLGQPVVVVTKAGASGMVGVLAGAQAVPDGYTSPSPNPQSRVPSKGRLRRPQASIYPSRFHHHWIIHHDSGVYRRRLRPSLENHG